MKLTETKLRQIIRKLIAEQVGPGKGFSMLSGEDIKEILESGLDSREMTVDFQPVADTMNDILSSADDFSGSGERPEAVNVKKIYQSLSRCLVNPGTKMNLHTRYRIENFAATLSEYLN